MMFPSGPLHSLFERHTVPIPLPQHGLSAASGSHGASDVASTPFG